MAEDPTTCDICSKQQAVVFCIIDKQNFCLNCLTIHQKIDSTSHHGMQCLLPQDSLIHIPCLHQDEHTFYCERHTELCCKQCKNSSHGECKNSVTSTEDLLQEAEKLKSQSDEIVRKLEKTCQEVDLASKTTAEREQDWVNRMQLELEKMNKAKNELEDKIGKKVDYMKGHMKKRREQLEQEKNNLQNAINEIGKHQMELNKQAAASSVEQLNKVALLKNCLKKHEELLSSKNEECHMAYLKTMEHDFEAEHYVSDTLHQFEETLKSLNTIYSEVQKYFYPTQIPKLNTETFPEATATSEQAADVTKVKTMFSSTSSRQRTQSERQVEGKEGMKGNRSRAQSESASMETTEALKMKTEASTIYRRMDGSPERRHRHHSTRSLEEYQQMVERKETDSAPSIPIQSHCQMTVRVPSDQTACGITGIGQLDDGYLLLADFENTKLKVFAPCGDFKGELNCEDKPRDMAKTENNMFLVNFPMAKKIYFVSVELDSTENKRQINLGKKIDTGAKCCGIAFHSNKIYVATQNPHQILIINIDGVIERTIKGDNMFERATYIAVDPDSSLIYISDPNRKVVLGITTDKEEKFRYKVERPHGIVCVGNGMLFVADWNWEVGTIHLVNRDGVTIGTLNIENCYCPQKLVFYTDRNTLLVTQWQKDVLTTIYLGDKVFAAM
ncbi:uncharacterized protein LOC123534762 isoform X2 [Mercenaria mercenaria]|uniref:uncharacterized protein LOC123534762 isoform X2 n=1 Tax=Mercenaria mercenaria TaxID=6596 RepID=UPI00234E881B|nr:uncharacterized protein LOC123534762 isoform X2 [Mercenaria mercenaria]